MCNLLDMSKASLGDTIAVKGITYKVVLSEEPSLNTKRANPSVVGWLGLQRPNGRKTFGAWQFEDSRVEICVSV